jgi:RNA polymerase sigma-70 factor (ECF subfamily)
VSAAYETDRAPEDRALDERAGNDQAVVAAVLAGDTAAFAAIVRRWQGPLVNLAWRFCRDRGRAEEMAQEAFLKVFRNLHLFRFDCSFHTWLYRIVTNVCLDHLRRRKVRKEDSTVVETPDGPVDQVSRIAEDGPAANPERQLWNRELSQGIAAALDGLTPRERTVFELRHYEGLRLRAIGDMLGTTEEAAKNCLFRATQKMRASLETFV